MENDGLDIARNRRARKYSRGEMLARVLWMFGHLLFRLTPRPLFGLRVTILRMFGATVGANVHVYPSTRIYMPWHLRIGDDSSIGEWALVYNLGMVTIGARCTVSHQAHLCAGTHDARDPALPLIKSEIVLGDDVWICADAFVGPDVTVAAGAVVGARAVAVKNVAAWTVVGGNPAQRIAERTLGGNGS